MIDNEQFKKVTGIDRNADADTMEKALAKAVTNQRTIEIKQALIIRELMDVWNWNIKTSAAGVGLASSTATRLGLRGRILNQTGSASLGVIYANILPMSDKELTELHAELLMIQTEEDINAHVMHRSGFATVAKALQCEPEITEAVLEMAREKGLTTPVALRGAIPALAASIDVVMPKKARETNSGDKKSEEAPTIEKTVAALTAWKTDRVEGSDKTNRFEMSDEEAASASQLIMATVHAMLSAGRLSDVAAIVEEIFEATDEFETKSKDASEAEVTAEWLATHAMGAQANA